MTIDCPSAQRVVSATFDGEVSDPRELEAVEDHCRTCPECSAFLSTLMAIRRLPAPEAPEGLLDRTIEAIRTEEVPVADRTAPSDDVSEPVGDTRPLTERRPDTANLEMERVHDDKFSAGVSHTGLPRWQGWARWAAAAAVFFIAAGVITAQGIRFLLSDEQSALRFSDTPTMELGSGGISDMTESADAPPAVPNDGHDGTSATDAPSASPGPSYVVVGQTAYRFEDMLADEPAGQQIGSLKSALDGDGEPIDRPVFEDSSSEAIVVAGEGDSYLRFEPVTRTFRGRLYGLRSSTIGAFGEWPRLPSGITEPTSPDGSPTFILSGTDDSGVKIYVRPGSDPSAGFAVAPGTAASDPAAGNPSWTWWEPLR